MAKNQKKYTQELKQQLVDFYNTGNYSFPQLSSEYGVAKSTILGWSCIMPEKPRIHNWNVNMA